MFRIYKYEPELDIIIKYAEKESCLHLIYKKSNTIRHLPISQEATDEILGVLRYLHARLRRKLECIVMVHNLAVCTNQ